MGPKTYKKADLDTDYHRCLHLYRVFQENLYLVKNFEVTSSLSRILTRWPSEIPSILNYYMTLWVIHSYWVQQTVGRTGVSYKRWYSKFWVLGLFKNMILREVISEKAHYELVLVLNSKEGNKLRKIILCEKRYLLKTFFSKKFFDRYQSPKSKKTPFFFCIFI